MEKARITFATNDAASLRTERKTGLKKLRVQNYYSLS
jgi:hypothetical protein